MEDSMTSDEAHAALRTIDRERSRVIEQISLPPWYLWGLAIGWVVLGVIADLGPSWLTTVTTFIFGAGHASVAPRVIDGRHGSERLQIGRDVVGRRISMMVIGALIALAGLTVAAALAVRADGARHAVTIASVLVATIVLLGGHHLIAIGRSRLSEQMAR
jgi:hypothetical protein